MKIHPGFTTAVLAVLANGPLAAEEPDTVELKPDLVVTPSRMPEARDRTLAPVSVISREDIRQSAAQDLFELLRLQPGVDIVRTGGPGTQTSIFLRGSNSNHVLVLVDGIRVSSANTGAYAWEQLPLGQVERVEIVRGPRGSLYGSDSIGGVIHIFTRSRPLRAGDGRQLRNGRIRGRTRLRWGIHAPQPERRLSGGRRVLGAESPRFQLPPGR